MRFTPEEQWIVLRMLERWLDRLPQYVLADTRTWVKAELHKRYRSLTEMGYRACPCRGPQWMN